MGFSTTAEYKYILEVLNRKVPQAGVFPGVDFFKVLNEVNNCME